MGDFSSRRGIAVVIGGSGGIGGAVVSGLVRQGARVALTYRNHVPTGLVDTLGSAATAHSLDVTDADHVAYFFAELLDRHGAIHTLVHAAGPHVRMVHLSKVSPADLALQVNADLNGFFTVASAALPALRALAGSIVVVTTAATRRATRFGMGFPPPPRVVSKRSRWRSPPRRADSASG